MSFEIIITPHYLDASASVKLLVPESNTDKIRSFFLVQIQIFLPLHYAQLKHLES